MRLEFVSNVEANILHHNSRVQYDQLGNRAAYCRLSCVIFRWVSEESRRLPHVILCMISTLNLPYRDRSMFVVIVYTVSLPTDVPLIGIYRTIPSSQVGTFDSPDRLALPRVYFSLFHTINGGAAAHAIDPLRLRFEPKSVAPSCVSARQLSISSWISRHLISADLTHHALFS
jgi:hypothetical protein